MQKHKAQLLTMFIWNREKRRLARKELMGGGKRIKENEAYYASFM